MYLTRQLDQSQQYADFGLFLLSKCNNNDRIFYKKFIMISIGGRK